jgi:quinol monooxygenase YgiN
MFIVQVHVRVKPEFIQDFKEATVENAKNSILEPGIARFDVIQHIEERNHFILVEVYRTMDDPVKHKSTEHYKIWSNTVSEMMAEPRQSDKFENIFPGEDGW